MCKEYPSERWLKQFDRETYACIYSVVRYWYDHSITVVLLRESGRTMRKEYPSERWLKQFDAAFVEYGGHSGSQTLKVCRAEYAVPLYRRGATSRAAGLAAVLAYRLHRRVTDLQEQVDGILSDVQAGRVPLELARLAEVCS